MSRRTPPRITPRYLRNAALHYLKRYFTARAHLARILMRKVDRSLDHHGGDRAEAAALVAALLDDLEAEGILDDALYARSKVQGLLRRGTSTRSIHQRLAQKGVSRDLVQACLDEARDEHGDVQLRAACVYVRKRRLGPYRDDPGAHRDKDLARLGRAGFPYPVARRVLDLETTDEIEELARG